MQALQIALAKICHLGWRPPWGRLFVAIGKGGFTTACIYRVEGVTCTGYRLVKEL